MNAYLFKDFEYPTQVDIEADLDVLQNHIGGYLEFVTGHNIPEGTALIVNEIAIGLTHNELASEMYGSCIHGPALWVGYVDGQLVDNEFDIVIEMIEVPPPRPPMHTLN